MGLLVVTPMIARLPNFAKEQEAPVFLYKNSNF